MKRLGASVHALQMGVLVTAVQKVPLSKLLKYSDKI